MADDSMPIRDAAGNLLNVRQENNGGIRTPRYAPEIAGAAVGVSNPMPVSGVVTGNVQIPAGTGTDRSVNRPTLLTTLATIAAKSDRVGFYIQSQAASQLQVVLDQDNTGTDYTVILVDPGNGANGQGADWSMAQAGIRHTARIRICGVTGAQFAAREY